MMTSSLRQNIFRSTRIVAVTVVFGMLGSSLVACGDKHNNANSTSTNDVGVTVKDDGSITYTSCGQEYTLDKHPKKVMSLGIGAINTLITAGGADKVLNRSSEYGEPPSSLIKGKVESIPVLSESSPSLEQVVADSPDWLYGEAFSSTRLTPQKVNEQGFATMIPEYECFNYYPDIDETDPTMQNIINEVRRVGKVLGTDSEAEKQATELEKSIKESKEMVADVPTQRVAVIYFFDQSNDFYSYGSKGVVQQMMNEIGHKNATDPNYFYHDGPLSPESFIDSDPDIVIIATGSGGSTLENSLERLKKIPGISNMRAFKENHIAEAPNAGFYPSAESVPTLRIVAESIKKFGGK